MSSCSLSYLGGMFDRAGTISCGSDAVTDPVTGRIIRGMVPGAPEAPPTEGTTTNTVNMAEGDKEEPQSVSMAPGG